MESGQSCDARPSGCRVNVYSTLSDIVHEGDIITITGELIGYDDMVVGLQWQVEEGFGWKDVPGATALTHSFVATQDTINLSWRLCVDPPGSPKCRIV